MRCARCGQEHEASVACENSPPRPGEAPFEAVKPTLPPSLRMAKSDLPQSLVGRTVGSYRLVRELGRGGMGVVYLGEHASIGSKVAIKVLHQHLASSAELVQRFWAEAKSVNLIAHSNIINIFDLSQLPGSSFYLVMEYLEGRSLAELTGAALSPDSAIPILLQVCDALDAAHQRGVIHRDIKPENIFLLRRGRQQDFVKVLDFGIAKLRQVDGGTDQTGAGIIVGTPDYMSPEQASGGAIDGRSDLYSLGCIAYRLATGRLPFQCTSIPAVLVAHAREVPVPPHEVNPQVPARWSEAILKALRKNPAERPQTAAEFARDLERVLQPAGASGPAMFGEEDASATKGAPESSAAPPSASLRPPSRPPTPMPAPNTIGEAEVSTERGQALGVFPCTSVSRGGLFLCTEGPLPPLMSLVRLRLPQLGGLTCEAQVVQHLRPDKAKQWHMSPGFGVQFGVLSEVQRSVLKEAALGHVVPPTPLPARPDRDDALAAAALARYAPKAGQDWYALLGVKREADFDEIRQKAREAKRTLEALAERPLSEGQRTQLAATIKRIETARDAIGLPGHRAEYDAASGNFEGVWRCLAAGLSVTELELARGRFLASHAGAESHGNVSFVTGQAFEKAGAIKDALASYAQGLTADPLNLRLHKLYWALKQRGGRSA